MKTKPTYPIQSGNIRLKHLAFAIVLGAGVSHGQAVIDVGGAGIIGDTTLTTFGGTKLSIEHSNSLAIGSWTTVAIPDTSSTVDDVVFTVSGSGPLDVTATIPATKAASGKLFGRLKAENP